MTNKTDFKKLADELRNVEAPIIDWFADNVEDMCLNATGEGLSKLNNLMAMLKEGTVSDPHDINYALDSIKSFGEKWTIPKEITTVLFNEYHAQPQASKISENVDHFYSSAAKLEVHAKKGHDELYNDDLRTLFYGVRGTALEYLAGKQKSGSKEFVEFLGLVGKVDAPIDVADLTAEEQGIICLDSAPKLVERLIDTYNAFNSEKLEVDPEMVTACYEEKLALTKLGNRVKSGHNMRFEVERSGEGRGELGLYISGISDDFEQFVETYGAVQDPRINHEMGLLNDYLDEMHKLDE
jgi:hypothetical protein